MKEIRNFICLLFIMICLNLNIINANSELKNDNNKINLMQTKISKIVEQRYTKKTIDITYLAMGEEVGHNHVYETKYDENNHWNECIICDKKIEITSHTYSENWTMGDSCAASNKLIHACDCGYSYQTNNIRTHKGYSDVAYANNSHHMVKYCSVCTDVEGTYSEMHTNSYGQILGCANGISGTCSKCNVWINATNHECWNFLNVIDSNQHYNSGSAFCQKCGKALTTTSTANLLYSGDDGTIMSCDFSVIFPWNMEKCSWISTSVGGFYPNNTGSIDTNLSWYEIHENTVTYHIRNAKVIPNYESSTTLSMNLNATTQDGTSITIHNHIYVIAEKTPPTILNISQRDITMVDDWSTSKEITITGTENYCGSVTIRVEDYEGNVYVDNARAIVNNKNYSYTFLPQIEADENGKEFTLKVTDSLGNVNTQKFTVFKVDNFAPTFISDMVLIEPWSKSKDVTFYAKDNGVKKVRIGFNDKSDLQLADEVDGGYQREYTFVGDVYGQTVARVYAEDGLGNIATEYVKLGNLDNTAPTITNLNKSLNETEENSKLDISVEANDINITLGKSGSGVSHYAITTSNNIPDESSDIWQESNLFEITENRTYYVWAKDLVGNISIPKELVVDELTTKYKVKYYLKDINGNNILEAEEEFTGKIGEIVTPIVKEYNGYKSPEPQTIKISSDGTTVIEYYYELIKGKIIITKVDKNDETKTLIGATFKVEKLDNQGSVDTTFTSIEKTTGENGKVEFIDLLVGDYLITEIKAPEGYELAKEPLKVSITKNENDIKLTAIDRLKLELPETGGRGIYLYLIIGIVIIIISVITHKKIAKK